MKLPRFSRRAPGSRWRAFVALACLATLVSLAAHRFEWRWGALLDAAAQDIGFALRGAASPAAVATQLPESKRIVIVELPHEVPRPLLAKLVSQLRLARVTALDLMLVSRESQLSPDEKPLFAAQLPLWKREDALLARAMKDAGNVVIGAWPDRVMQPIPGAPGQVEARVMWTQPAPVFCQSARLISHLGVIPDAHDGLIRRVRLWEHLATPRAAPLPAFALSIAAADKKVTPRALAATMPASRDGTTAIGYLGPRDCFEYESNRIVFERALSVAAAEDFRDALVFVGQTDYRSKDTFATPFGDMPGLLIHANITAALLSSQGPPRPLGAPWLALLTLAAALIIVLPLVRYPLPVCAPVALLECVGLALVCGWAFARGNVIASLSAPVLAVFLVYNGVVLLEYARARATLRRVVGKAMVGRLLDALENPSLGGREAVATAFFCDLRGYSEISQQLAPPQLLAMLNVYTEALVGVVAHYEGRPIDYFGDGVFVLFEGQNHARRGVEAALEAQRVLEREFETLRALGREKTEFAPLAGTQLSVGIALDSGPMLIGLVGAQQHFKPGAVGDAINIAARVQGLTADTSHSILITRRTLETWQSQLRMASSELPVPMQPLFCGAHFVKGRRESLEVFGVGAARKVP